MLLAEKVPKKRDNDRNDGNISNLIIIIRLAQLCAAERAELSIIVQLLNGVNNIGIYHSDTPFRKK